jgi:simple sugar transport system substrate-binding protein
LLRSSSVYALLLLAGCGKVTPATPTADSKDTLSVGFLYIGSRDDYGYNQAHAEGARAVKELPGIKIREQENVPDSIECQKAMTRMIELEGARVIFPTSFGYFDPHMLKLARQYPDVTFLHCGGLYDETQHPKNVGTYFGFIDECQYLSGIVAAHVTQSKKLGFVAGKPIAQVRRNINAFVLGARSVDPSITCSVVFNGDWYMPSSEAEATNNLIDTGADVITCHVNSPRVVIESAERRGAATCGYHFNQNTLAPRGYLTGAEWNWEKIYVDYIKAIEAKTPVHGMKRGGLKEGFVRMSPFGARVPEAAKKRMADAQARLLSGDLTIFEGPLLDNSGRTVIAAGTRLDQKAVELETMDYLVEGVIAK